MNTYGGIRMIYVYNMYNVYTIQIKASIYYIHPMAIWGCNYLVCLSLPMPVPFAGPGPMPPPMYRDRRVPVGGF